jgi:hypothetical protein
MIAQVAQRPAILVIDHRGQGSGRAVHDLTRTGQPESLTNRRPIAANQHPYGKADKAGNANACRDIGRRGRRARGHGPDLP